MIIAAVAAIAIGLLVSIVGVFVFSLGEFRSQAAEVRYQAIDLSFERTTADMPWWKRWALRLAARYGPTEIFAMSQESVFESFPRRFWGLLPMVLGTTLQLVGALLAAPRSGP